MSSRKIILKEFNQSADTYVGRSGEVWFQEGTTTIRFGDDVTAGGISLSASSDPISLSTSGVTWGVWLSAPVQFRKNNYTSAVDDIAPGVQITRGNAQGLYNPLEEGGWNGDGPTYTEWNADGWNDLADVTARGYSTWNSVAGGYPPGLINQQLVMHDTLNDQYYTVQFHTWQGGGEGGAFSYTRQKINTAARFTKTDNGSEVDAIAAGLSITRDGNGGIYNPLEEGGWDSDVSPVGTLWNMDGWDNLTDVTTRQYLTFYTITGYGNLGKRVLGQQFVMKDVINNEYWRIMFTHWTPNGNGGGFSYVREKINLAAPQSGITFSDGSNQTTAFTEEKLGVVPQLRWINSYDRWLNLGDIGKQILVTQSGTNIIVPDYVMQPFPIGSAITIVNISGGNINIYMDNDNENNSIYGAGTADVGTSWVLPDSGGGNIATLLKIQQNSDGGGDGNNWMLSGPGIYLD